MCLKKDDGILAMLTYQARLNAKGTLKRWKARLYRARCAEQHDGLSIRKAASRFHVAKSTFHEALTKYEIVKPIGRPTEFST